MKFEVTMTFKKGPALTVNFSGCISETQAIREAKEEAIWWFRSS